MSSGLGSLQMFDWRDEFYRLAKWLPAEVLTSAEKDLAFFLKGSSKVLGGIISLALTGLSAVLPIFTMARRRRCFD